MRFTLHLGWLSASCLLPSCFFVDKVVQPNYWTCPDMQCDTTLELDVQDILDCYTDPQTQEVDLPLVLVPCEAYLDQDVCVLDVGLFSYEWYDYGRECCAWTEEEAEDCCEAAHYELTYSSDEAFSDLIADIEAGCVGMRIDYEKVETCFFSGNPTADPQDCDELSAAAFHAEYELLIDPALSWIDVTLDQEVISSTLSGHALVATQPRQALAGLAFAEDFQAFGDDFEDVFLVLTEDIVLGGSGSLYTVPVSQDFELGLGGVRDGVEFSYGFAP